MNVLVFFTVIETDVYRCTYLLQLLTHLMLHIFLHSYPYVHCNNTIAAR